MLGELWPDQRGFAGKHDGGFDLSGVDAEAVFGRVYEPVEVLSLGVDEGQVEPADAVNDEVEAASEFARHDVHHAGVAAVSVEKHEFAHACLRDGSADVGPEGDDGFGSEIQGAWKALMFGAVADGLCGQDVGREFCRGMCCGCTQNGFDDVCIDRQWQVWAMLFGGGDGQDGQAGRWIHAGEIGGAKVGPAFEHLRWWVEHVGMLAVGDCAEQVLKGACDTGTLPAEGGSELRYELDDAIFSALCGVGCWPVEWRLGQHA